MRKVMITAAILVLSSPLVAQRTVNCASTHNRRHFCPANTRDGVVLLQENSDNVCQQGSTWNYTPRGITVSGGCDAQFQIGGNKGNGANANGSYGNNQNNGDRGNDGSDSRGDANNNNGSYGNNGNARGDNDDSRRNRQSNQGNGYPNNNQNNYPQNNGNNQNNYPQNNGNNQNGYGNQDGNRQQARVDIPSGTRLDVRLEQAVSAANVNQGDFLPMTLVNNVSVNGKVIAPSGTPVQAKVVSAQGSPLDIRLDSMTVNGQNYSLVSSSIHSERDSQSAQNGGNETAGQALGSLLGNIGGGAQLQSGSVFTFRLTSPSRPTASNQ